jgi:hypothetical protein
VSHELLQLDHVQALSEHVGSEKCGEHNRVLGSRRNGGSFCFAFARLAAATFAFPLFGDRR